MKMHVVLEAQEDGGFVAYVPELPGCYSQGETRSDALSNVKQAADLYLEIQKQKHALAPKVEVLSLEA